MSTDNLRLLYPPETIARYFKKNTEQQVAHFVHSVEAADAFLQQYPQESLAAGKGRPRGLASALQYFKDETFLTLYAFVSLDLAGSREHQAERERLYTELLQCTLPRLEVGVRAPELELERQLPAPRTFVARLAHEFTQRPETCHPVRYVRAMSRGNRDLEGATHTDATLTCDDRMVMFEAKFLSDISTSTTYAPERNQLTRNLDAGLEAVGLDLSRFAYVFVTPQCFRERPQSRFYGYKLSEYMDTQNGPNALRRDLPHLADRVDMAELSCHIGWASWEEVCSILSTSRVFNSPEYPHTAVEAFFRERCLWPDQDH